MNHMVLRICLCMLMLLTAAGAQQPPAKDAKAAPSADNLIYDQIRQALTFDRDVRGAAIEVIVKDGDVVLRGRVRDVKARDKATKLAKKVKGVKNVTSELRLFADQ